MIIFRPPYSDISAFVIYLLILQQIEGVCLAEIDAPPGHQPPPKRNGGGSDMSGAGLAKAAGGCIAVYCLLCGGVIFLFMGSIGFLFPPIGLPFMLIGAVCIILGLFAARWEWGVLKGSSG